MAVLADELGERPGEEVTQHRRRTEDRERVSGDRSVAGELRLRREDGEVEIVEVVAAVIYDGDRVLACRRRPEKAAGGLWEFPGGKIERGETPSQALAREIREELGILISVDSLFTLDDTVVGDRVIRLGCWSSSIRGALPQSSTDHDELRWVTRDELASLEWATPDLPAVTKLQAST